MQAAQGSESNATTAADRRGRFLVDVPTIALGLAVLAYGIVMTVSTPWGTSPWNVFHLGLVKQTPLTLGQASQATSLLVAAAAWAVKRTHVTPITLVNAIAVGWLIDFYRAHHWVPFVDGFWGLVYLELGVMVFALGMALYLAPQWGAGPRDALMMSLSDRLGRPVGPVRIAIDAFVVVAGGLLGGPIGIGTVLTALTLGPWAQTYLPALRRLNRRLHRCAARQRLKTGA